MSVSDPRIYVVMENVSENDRNIVVVVRDEFGYFLSPHAASKVADKLNHQWRFRWIENACSHELSSKILGELYELAENADNETFIDALGWHLPDDTLYNLNEELHRFAVLQIDPHDQSIPITL